MQSRRMHKTGKLVVISGPSGAGKTSIARQVVQCADAQFSVSATTRRPRPDEIDGREYHFVDRPAFEAMIERGELLEWAEVFGELYGTPAAPVDEALAGGRTILLDVDVQGGRQVYEKMPQATFVLVVPPSRDELALRLRGRGSEGEAQLAKRLAKVEAEIAAASACGAYNHTVVNDDLDQAVRQVVEIVAK